MLSSPDTMGTGGPVEANLAAILMACEPPSRLLRAPENVPGRQGQWRQLGPAGADLPPELAAMLEGVTRNDPGARERFEQFLREQGLPGPEQILTDPDDPQPDQA